MIESLAYGIENRSNVSYGRHEGTTRAKNPVLVNYGSKNSALRLPILVAALVLLWFGSLVGSAAAHELEVDSLSVRLNPETGELAGQFLLDPEITRPGGSQTGGESDQAEERSRLLSFVKSHVVFEAGSHVVDLSLEVRELYVKGGAVPGDSVMYQATLPAGWRSLSVAMKAPLEQLAVTTTIRGASQPTILVSGARPFVLYQIENKMGSASEATEGTAQSSLVRRSALLECIRYVGIGIVHIVPYGWDHILFVMALTLGSLGKWRRLLLELSAFTVAHTVTLALGSLRVVTLASSVVEPLIAFSITAVALEQLVDLKSACFRYALVGFFGLLHGLGFAGALLDLGFSGQSFFLFLASFNVGVELGQFAVVGVCLCVFLPFARRPEVLKTMLRVVGLAIAACGLVVGIVRLTG